MFKILVQLPYVLGTPILVGDLVIGQANEGIFYVLILSNIFDGVKVSLRTIFNLEKACQYHYASNCQSFRRL